MSSTPLSRRAIWQWLAVLSSREQQDFVAYLACPAFNSNPTLRRIVELLVGKGRRKRPPTLETLSQKADLAPSTLEKSFSLLMNHLRRFVAERARAEAGREDPGAVLRWMEERGLEPAALENEFRYAQRKLGQRRETPATFYDRLDLADQWAEVQSQAPRQRRDSIFEDSVQALEDFYTVHRLKLACAALNEWRVLGGEAPDFDAAAFLAARPSPELPSLGQAYLATFRLLQSNRPAFADLIAHAQWLDGAAGAFHRREQVDLYGFLLNASFRGVDMGHVPSVQLVNDVFDAMLDRGLLTEGGQMESRYFKNIVTIKVRISDLAGARAFIGRYADQLPPEEAVAVLPYTRGVVDFHSGAYASAAEAFKEVLAGNPADVFWGIEARTMLWKTYFLSLDTLDADTYDEMQRHCEAFRMAVARNERLSDYHQTCYANFIRVFSRLFSIVAQPDSAARVQDLLALQAEVLEMDAVANKAWLVAALAERTTGSGGESG